MYGNCLDLSSDAFDNCAFAPSIAFDSRSTLLLHLCFVTLSIFYGPEFFSLAFSVSLSEVPYYFWATMYSLLVRINTRYLFN